MEIKAEKPLSQGLEYQHRAGIKTASRIQKLGCEEMELDLSRLSWLHPPYIAPIACALQSKKKECDIRLILPSDSQTSKYLRTIDFPTGSGSEHQLRGDAMPLCTLEVEGEVLEATGSQINELLLRKFDSSPRRVIQAI